MLLIDLLYPALCPACGKNMEQPNTVCEQCIQALNRTEHSWIRQNNVEQVFEQLNHPTKQRMRHLFFTGGAWLKYDKHTRLLIHKAKYNRQPEILTQLAAQAAHEWDKDHFFDGIELIIPVPLHSKRLRQRGYNQSDFIAQGLNQVTNIPVDTTAIIRVKDTPKQARMIGHDARRKNISNAFELINPKALKGKHILIVDDVITTGATINEMIKTITPYRSVSVSVFAIAAAL